MNTLHTTSSNSNSGTNSAGIVDLHQARRFYLGELPDNRADNRAIEAFKIGSIDEHNCASNKTAPEYDFVGIAG